MMRVTPLRFTTLQCSQIGFTLVRTFTGAPDGQKVCGQTRTVTRPVNSSKGPGCDPEAGLPGTSLERCSDRFHGLPSIRRRRHHAAYDSICRPSRGDRFGRDHTRLIVGSRRSGSNAGYENRELVAVLVPNPRSLLAAADHAVR